MRKLSYVQALNESLDQILEEINGSYLIGQGVDSPWYAGKSTIGLLDKHGNEKVFDTPISENGLTGAAIGSALAGMRPIVFQSRMDFMLYSMDPIFNQAATWYYMFGNQLSVPLTIWAVINRGGQQGSQHAQALQSVFAHLPGIKVVMPSNAYDLKGLLYSSVLDNNPVLIIDERWLYDHECEVPEELYKVDIGKGKVVKEGKDLTVVATSFMVPETLSISERLNDEFQINIEIIDPRTIKPLDIDLINQSVSKTGRLLVVDAAWKSFGVGAEISASVSESNFYSVKNPIERLSLPDTPAPTNKIEEDQYFLNSEKILEKILNIMKGI